MNPTVQCFLEASAVPLLLYLLLFFIIVASIVQTVRRRNSMFTKNQRGVFYFNLIYCIVIAITCVAWGLAQFFYCVHHESFELYLLMGLIGFTVSCHCLMYIYFYRLYFIFKGTPFCISSRLVRAFYVLYAILSLFSGLFCYVLSDEDMMSTPFGLFVTLTFFGLGCSLFTMYYMLFIRKLLQVAKQDKDANGVLLNVAAKTFVISFMAIAMCCVFFAVVVVVSLTGWNVHLVLLNGITTPLELLSDYASILLSLKEYDGLYMKLFKPCHARFIRIMERFSGISSQESNLSETQLKDDVAKFDAVVNSTSTASNYNMSSPTSTIQIAVSVTTEERSSV